MPDAPVSIVPTPSSGGAPVAPESVLATPGAGGSPGAPLAILATPGAGGSPTAPLAILATPSAGGSPTAPLSILATPGAGGSPSVPVSIMPTPGSGGVPAAPDAVLEVAMNGSGSLTCIIGGTVEPDATGELVAVEELSSLAYPESDQWSTDGANAAPTEGLWVQLYTARLITPEAATIEAIAPKANYVATGSQSTASKIVVLQLGVATKLYWLYDLADGNPSTSRWVDAGDGTMADQGATVIPAGRMLLPTNRLTMGGFLGGLGATWEAAPDAQWLFVLTMHEDGGQTGIWYGQGGSPSTATWSPQSGATGVPTVTLSGILPPASVLP